MNKKISTTLAFTIIIVLAVIVGGLFVYSYYFIRYEENPLLVIHKKLKGKLKEDCIPAGQSADEYSFGKYIGPKKCCEGLVKITNMDERDGKCLYPPDAGTICSDCGNNNCEEWENRCNCPKDCE